MSINKSKLTQEEMQARLKSADMRFEVEEDVDGFMWFKIRQWVGEDTREQMRALGVEFPYRVKGEKARQEIGAFIYAAFTRGEELSK